MSFRESASKNLLDIDEIHKVLNEACENDNENPIENFLSHAK